MTTNPSRPELKSPPSTTNRAMHARPEQHQTHVGESKVSGREAVLSVLRSNQQQRTGRWGDGRVPVAWLHVVAPPDWEATPTAHSWCECGRDRFVVGRRKALALVEEHNAHRTTCPLLGGTATEGRKAA
jgi:hypothetical protein